MDKENQPLLLNDFDFDLPQELIAQTPLQKRDDSRLLVLDRQTKTWQDDYFYHLGKYLKKGDVLVRNNSKVIPARLYGYKEDTHAHVEILLLKQKEMNQVLHLKSNQEIMDLFTMTPYYYKSPKEGHQKLKQINNLCLTASFVILVYQKA